MKKITLFLFVLAIAVSTAKAQHPPRPMHENKPEKVAEMYADMLERDLLLSKKQYKKVYKICLKQAKKTQSEISAYHPAGGPSMMERGGMSMNPGQGPGGGGQRPGMGGGHGPGVGQMPPQKGKMPHSGLSGTEAMLPGESEKDIQEQEKKMKKILDSSQFILWQDMEKKRSDKEKEQKRIEEQERLFPPYEK